MQARAADFTAERAWGSLELMAMGGYAASLHWTDQPRVLGIERIDSD